MKDSVKRIVIVGTGFSGSIIAREIAEKLDMPVTVVEKRDHIAGNMFDEMDEHGILVQRYGPHVLVTDEWSVIAYLAQFSEMFPHTVKELSEIDGRYVRLPFNFESIQQLLGYEEAETVIRKLRREFPGVERVPVLDLVNHKDIDISSFGNLLFEKSYRTYCAKQWDVPPEKLDKSIMGRSAIALSYDERYMNKDFQFLPRNGFTELFRSMLNHPNISVECGCDALDHIRLNECGTVFYDGEPVDVLAYTGAVDELFQMKYGELPYRSLDIRYEWFDEEQVYPEKIISYPQAKRYTRKTEYKLTMYDRSRVKGSVVATEYPVPYEKGGKKDPFYPVITAETKDRYEKYRQEAKWYRNIFLCGRLAEFRYYNMDDCILRALHVSREIQERLQSTGE